MPSDTSTAGTYHDCSNCGAEIRKRISAYKPWDEAYSLKWTPASDDTENVEDSDSGGKHPDRVTKVFCSRDCLTAFIQMDRQLSRSVDTAIDHDGGDDGGC